jgi:excinuclease ABC subunit A
MKLLFARIGRTFSPISGQEVKNTVPIVADVKKFDLESKWLPLHQFIWKKGAN